MNFEKRDQKNEFGLRKFAFFQIVMRDPTDRYADQWTRLCVWKALKKAQLLTTKPRRNFLICDSFLFSLDILFYDSLIPFLAQTFGYTLFLFPNNHQEYILTMREFYLM